MGQPLERRWAARYTDANGKQRSIGLFDTQEQAARAVDAAIRRAGLEGLRNTNSVDANGPLVPKPSGARDRKRRREETAAPPPAPPRRRVSAPSPPARDDLDLDRTAAYLL